MKRSVREYLLTGVGERKRETRKEEKQRKGGCAGGKVGRIGGHAGLIEGGHP